MERYDFKVLVLGDFGTGKTSWINQFIKGSFTERTRSTCGPESKSKTIPWDADTLIRVQLWDIAGQERLRTLSRAYFTGALGAFFVFDLTRLNSFACLKKLKKELDSRVVLKDDQRLPCVLLGNKCDLYREDEQEHNPHLGQRLVDKLDTFSREQGFCQWLETSAKDGTNVEEAVKCLMKEIYERTIAADLPAESCEPHVEKFGASIQVRRYDRDRERRTAAGNNSEESNSRCCVIL